MTNSLHRLQECRRLATAAHLWSITGMPGAQPLISRKRRDSMTELAFLRDFLAWETFLERSFTLYLSGQQPTRGRPPHRYTFPPNLRASMEGGVPEGLPYATRTRFRKSNT